MDLIEIYGQEHCKRALEVACVGLHNVLLIGPRKSGKTMLADAIRQISDISINEMLPCKCGYFTDLKLMCTCTPQDIQKHLGSLDRQMLDQCDIHIEVPRLDLHHLTNKRKGETTQEIVQRIEQCKDRRIPSEFDKEADELLKLAILELGISSVSYDKILRVAKTIARMDSKDIVEAHHISEAISYRSLDRNLWG